MTKNRRIYGQNLVIPAIVVGLTFWEVHFASDENIAAGHVKKGKRSMKFEICLSFES